MVLPADNELLAHYKEHRHDAIARRLDTLHLLTKLRYTFQNVECLLYKEIINHTIIRIDRTVLLVGLNSHHHEVTPDPPTFTMDRVYGGEPAKAIQHELEFVLRQSTTHAGF